jgi:hypothetical protein
MKKFINITLILLTSAFLSLSIASEAFSARMPDLIVKKIKSLPASVERDESFSITTKVKNIGNKKSGKSNTLFYFSQDGYYGSEDILLTGSLNVPKLLPKQGAKGSAKITIPQTTSPGDYYVIACADDTMKVDESDESNNCKVSDTTITVTTLTTFTGFDFALKQGDFWEYKWDFYDHTWAQGSSGHTDTDAGTFRITLGPPKVINNITAYQVLLSGRSRAFNFHDGRYERDFFSSKWKYLAMVNGQMLGSTDGATLDVIFDATDGKWAGGGFFVDFPNSKLITAKSGTISNNYISGAAIQTGQSISQTECQIILGIRICGDSSINYNEYEYFMGGIGPVGYYYFNQYSYSGGGFSSGGLLKDNVGLSVSSLRGEAVSYDLEIPEIEPNHGCIRMCFSGICVCTTQTIKQSVDLHKVINADIDKGDPGTVDTRAGDSTNNLVQDWYQFTLYSSAVVSVIMDFSGSHPDNDLDIYLFDSSNVLAKSIRDNKDLCSKNTADCQTEFIKYTLSPGTYLVGVQAWNTVSRSNYTLIID